MKKSQEDFKVVEQEQVCQVAALSTGHNKLKGNFNLLNYTLIVTFAVILGLSLSIYTSYQDEMRNLSADLCRQRYIL